MQPILTLTNLTKKFGPITAVNNLTVTIEKGNVYGILGLMEVENPQHWVLF